MAVRDRPQPRPASGRPRSAAPADWRRRRDESLEEILTVDADALGDLTRAESIEALREAVFTLPVKYREAVVLCDLQEMSYADAASALGCAVGTVRSRLHRGRALLAVKLAASQRVESGDPVRRRETPARVSALNRSLRSVRNLV